MSTAAHALPGYAQEPQGALRPASLGPRVSGVIYTLTTLPVLLPALCLMGLALLIDAMLRRLSHRS